MNKLVDASIRDSVLKFTVITDSAIINSSQFTVFINECSNKNIMCDDPNLQDYVLYYNNSVITMNRYTNEDNEEVTIDYKYVITIESELIKQLDNNLKYIKLYCTTEKNANDYIDGIFYDPEVIYNAEIKSLHCYCSNCLDDKQMQKIMLIVFKRQLLESAILSNHSHEAVQYFKDLCRILNISVKSTDCRLNCCSNNGCTTCKKDNCGCCSCGNCCCISK